VLARVTVAAFAVLLGLTHGARADVVFLVNLSDQQLARIERKIAPAKLHEGPVDLAYMTGQVESIDGIVAVEGQLEARFTFRAWWRESEDDDPIWSDEAAELQLRYVPNREHGKEGGARGFDIWHQIDNELDLRLMYSDVDRQVGPIGSAAWVDAVRALMDPTGEVTDGDLTGVDRDALRYRGWRIRPPGTPHGGYDHEKFAEQRELLLKVRAGELPPEQVTMPMVRVAFDPFVYAHTRRMLPHTKGFPGAIVRHRRLHGQRGSDFREVLRIACGLGESMFPINAPPTDEQDRRSVGRRQWLGSFASGEHALRPNLQAVRSAMLDHAIRLAGFEQGWVLQSLAAARDRQEDVTWWLQRVRRRIRDQRDTERRKDKSRTLKLTMMRRHDLAPASRIDLPPTARAREAMRILREHGRWTSSEELVEIESLQPMPFKNICFLGGRFQDKTGESLPDPLLLGALPRQRAKQLRLRQPADMVLPIQREARRTMAALTNAAESASEGPVGPKIAAFHRRQVVERWLMARDQPTDLDALLWLWTEVDDPAATLPNKPHPYRDRIHWPDDALDHLGDRHHSSDYQGDQWRQKMRRHNSLAAVYLTQIIVLLARGDPDHPGIAMLHEKVDRMIVQEADPGHYVGQIDPALELLGREAGEHPYRQLRELRQRDLNEMASEQVDRHLKRVEEMERRVYRAGLEAAKNVVREAGDIEARRQAVRDLLRRAREAASAVTSRRIQEIEQSRREDPS